jgi:predicted nucleotidyltransferase
MGGNAFSDVQPLLTHQAWYAQKETIKKLRSAGLTDFAFVGSINKQLDSYNDIDVAVQVPAGIELFDYKNSLYFPLAEAFGPENIRRIGSGFSCRYQIQSLNVVCQLDVIPCRNLECAQFLMQGVMRNLLFSCHAAQLSKQLLNIMNVKITITPTHGLVIKMEGWSEKRIYDPTMILSTLEIFDTRPHDVLTAESLAAALIKNGHLQTVKSFDSYVPNEFKERSDFKQLSNFISTDLKYLELCQHIRVPNHLDLCSK